MNETRQLIDYMKQKTGFRFDREVATALGIDPTYLSHAIRLNRPPWPQIESTFPGWMDELKHFLELKRQDARSAQDEPRTVGIPSDYREIPVYNVRVSAGHGELPGVEAIKQLVQMPRMFLPSNGQIGIVRVEGDSMFPTISHGDHVAVEFGSGYTSDGLYLIRIEDAAFVKRLQREFGQIRIISDNTLYREMVVHPEDEQQFSLIGRVALILRVT